MYQGTCADMYDDVTRNDSSEIDAILAALTDLPEASVVIDAGCGSGRLTLPLLTSLPIRVLALDVSPRMIQLLEDRLSDASQHPQLDSRVADITALPEDVHASAYVLGTSTISHFSSRDRARVLSGAHRSLERGGRLVMTYAPRSIPPRPVPVTGGSGRRYWFSAERGDTPGTTVSILQSEDRSSTCRSLVYDASVDTILAEIAGAGFVIDQVVPLAGVEEHILVKGVKR